MRARSRTTEWFDSDTYLPKAARTMQTTIKKIQAELEMQKQAGEAALMEFKDVAKHDDVAQEKFVLQNRLHAVELVLASGRPRVGSIIAK